METTIKGEMRVLDDPRDAPPGFWVKLLLGKKPEVFAQEIRNNEDGIYDSFFIMEGGEPHA